MGKKEKLEAKNKKPEIKEKENKAEDLLERLKIYRALKEDAEKEIKKIEEEIKKIEKEIKKIEKEIKKIEEEYDKKKQKKKEVEGKYAKAKKVLDMQCKLAAEQDWEENIKMYYESLADGTEKYKNYIAPYISFFYDAAKLLGCLAGCTSEEAFEKLEGSIENYRSWLKASARQRNFTFEKWKIPFFPSLESPKKEGKNRSEEKEKADMKQLQECYDKLIELLEKKEVSDQDLKEFLQFEEIINKIIKSDTKKIEEELEKSKIQTTQYEKLTKRESALLAGYKKEWEYIRLLQLAYPILERLCGDMHEINAQEAVELCGESRHLLEKFNEKKEGGEYEFYWISYEDPESGFSDSMYLDFIEGEADWPGLYLREPGRKQLICVSGGHVR